MINAKQSCWDRLPASAAEIVTVIIAPSHQLLFALQWHSKKTPSMEGREGRRTMAQKDGTER